MGFMDEIFRACKAREVTPEQAGGHSGEFETSLMLSVRAALVFEKGFRAATENGVLGDPSDASAANGEAYLAAITDLLVGFIKAHKPK
jgi:creatinine amidohydrolase/Fe(II)-dependent formamide hydrolase-like protein